MWEFIKENKKVRKQEKRKKELDQESDQENKKSTKKVIKKKKESFFFFSWSFLVFLIAILVEFLFSSLFSFFLDRFLGRALFSLFLTFLFSFINAHLWKVPLLHWADLASKSATQVQPKQYLCYTGQTWTLTLLHRSSMNSLLLLQGLIRNSNLLHLLLPVLRTVHAWKCLEPIGKVGRQWGTKPFSYYHEQMLQ